MEATTELKKNIKHLKDAKDSRVKKLKAAVKDSQVNRHRQTEQQNRTE